MDEDETTSSLFSEMETQRIGDSDCKQLLNISFSGGGFQGLCISGMYKSNLRI